MLAPPSGEIEIPSPEYAITLRWWLGAPLITDLQQRCHSCPACASAMDPHGDHFVSCPRNNYYGRHVAIQDGSYTWQPWRASPMSARPHCPMTPSLGGPSALHTSY